MNMAIFRNQIISEGHFYDETVPVVVDKKEETMAPVELPVTEKSDVADLWKTRIRLGYPGIYTTNPEYI